MSDNDDLQKQKEELEKAYDTDHEIGEQNINPLGLDLHNPVFVVSAGLILLFVIGALLFPDQANDSLGATQTWIQETFDWLFLSAGNLFVLFALALILLPIGRIRIGGQDAKPDFGLLSWFSMLFAAGMGIGLMFWAVAEPVGYFTEWFGTPLGIEGGTEASKQAALGATMYHWGLHPWAVYAIVGLALAFFAYNKGLPLTIRSAFYPILGERVWGPFGHVIDTLAVLATLFGLATSLGLGAQQAAAGLDFLFDGIDGGLQTQLAVIIGVTIIALLSVMRGIDGGVKLLSNLNLIVAAVLMLFVMIFGGFIAFLANTGTTLSAYVQYIIPLSNPVGREDETFYHSWTIFFWAWWISWSPFVGMFIARVSRGRTVRQFVTAVLIVPTLVTVVWMSVFGGTGIDQVRDGIGALADEGITDSSLALFQMLQNLPLAAITSFLAVVLVLVFFITSSDSGSLVIDSITSGGKTDAPQSQRLFWATIEGVIAAVLLAVGGAAALEALQAGAVSTGLPFMIVLLVMSVSLLMGLFHELKLIRIAEAEAAGKA
ncbi:MULTISPECIES: BCCT family transporter [unclassified Thioalkalivibrio]|uniref:BCCT family transporter n=1 Tax=unclassified Thioalkalivibrio TaxID=2621013 RepID=UPI00037A5CFC|nr:MULTISPECIES: BCCT family transporter [unclassified Thioalkalivibrio]PYG03861.1 BCCT family betaine/carnitine transporter [Thioalkalivibrio sp. ALE21]